MSGADVKITADERTGFPILALPGILFRVSWLPLTWVQLEYFLAGAAERQFDGAWYSELAGRAGRGSLAAVDTRQPYTLLVRGLNLYEVRSINRWWSTEHSFVPTASEWQEVQQVALTLPPLGLAQLQKTAIRFNPRALRLLEMLESIRDKTPGKPNQLADQMLLRGGVREVVMLDRVDGVAAAIGEPHRSIEPFADKLLLPLIDDNCVRRTSIGSRLFLRP